MDPQTTPRRGRLDRALPFVFVALAVILVLAVVLAISLLRAPDLVPIQIPSASSA